MCKAEQALVLNPKISQYEKKYILGVDHEAVKLYKELCSRKIYVDGFVDEDYAGILFFHKPVFSIGQIEKKNIVLLTLDKEKWSKDYPVCSDIFVFNGMLAKTQIMIYGAGFVGEMVCTALQNKGFQIKGFIDSDKAKVGSKICDVEIFDIHILEELSEDTIVIEAGKGFQEMDICIQNANEKLFRFVVSDWPFTSSKIWVDREKNISLNLSCIPPLQEYYEKNKVKELILYGNDILLAEKYAKLYECLDFYPISFMTECKDNVVEDVAIIDEILYKKDYLILMYEEDDGFLLRKLYELGVERNCGHVNYECSPSFYNRELMLDVNLGYTYEMNSEYPGVYVYGNNRKNDYKIVVLGGSTTDSALDQKIRSWVEIMFDKYCQRDITIFNGAISGYSSAQEMLKLIRDMLKLSPDMVIVYDGYNDVFLNLEGDFAYLESLVRFAGKYIKCLDKSIKDNRVWKGIQTYDNAMDGWLENIQNMYAIAKSRNARFFSFVQPMLCTKKKMDKHSGSLMKMMNYVYSQDILTSARKFRERVPKLEKLYPYITDLSDIFDDIDVYMDMCHVYEYGNEIIAEYIWNVIKKDCEEHFICY